MARTQEQQAGGINTNATEIATQQANATASGRNTTADLAQGPDKVKSGTFTEFGQDLAKTIPNKPPSLGQDINSILAPYFKELTNLGPEYQSEMEYLKPYLSPEYGQSQEQAVAKQYGGSGVKAPATNPLEASEENLASSIENQPKPGFGEATALMKDFEKSLPYQQALTAGVGYQKYLSTYGGQPVPTTGWSPEAAGAYQALTGATTAGGLPSPLTAATNLNSQNKATSLLSGGNPSAPGQ